MLKIGIIGAGRIGKVHLESISYHVKNATVVAMADPFMNDETEAFIKGFGLAEKAYGGKPPADKKERDRRKEKKKSIDEIVHNASEEPENQDANISALSMSYFTWTWYWLC